MALLFFMVYFGWIIWGVKSLKAIYIPVILGSIIILCFSIPTRNYFFVPVAGFLIGWLIIGIAIFVFDYDYFKGGSANPIKYNSPEILPENYKQVIKKEFVEIQNETPLVSNYDHEYHEKVRLIKIKENPAAIYDVVNWSDAMLKAALSNKTYRLPMYKNTLLKIELELAKRGLLKNLEKTL